ncbi:site-2 protease family protein, partial [Clostridium saudiense]|nr:site-2 protease family protein [Clostridium saudiense]
MKLKRWKQILLSEFLLVAVLVNIDKTFILACCCILIHEFSHTIVAKLKGSRFNNLQFHIYGAKVELMDLDELTDKDKIIIYISGAMSNIVIMIIAWIISKHSNNEIFETLFKLNFSLAFFNLLPAYPLDGARVAEIILARKITYKRAQKTISIISYIIATFFILISISAAIFLKEFNISLIAIGIIMIDITKTEEKSTMYI